jgi:hypothetical protein
MTIAAPEEHEDSLFVHERELLQYAFRIVTLSDYVDQKL